MTSGRLSVPPCIALPLLEGGREAANLDLVVAAMDKAAMERIRERSPTAASPSNWYGLALVSRRVL